MIRFRCINCYDEFEAESEDAKCPTCGAQKSKFEIGRTEPEVKDKVKE